MSAKTLAALEQELDGWAAALAKLEAAGASEAARRPLIEKIGRGQAELLANNPNMYIDAGNIKTLVTRRDIDLKKIESALGQLDQASLTRLGTVFTQERYLKILGEGTHIDHAFQAIRLGNGSPAEIANALKAFSKHGRRVIDTVGADLAHGIHPIDWALMDAQFARIMQAAKEGELIGQVARELDDLRALAALHGAQLEAAMTTVSQALRQQAGLGAALTAQQAAGVTEWARAAATARLQREALDKALQQLAHGVRAGRVAADAFDLAAPDPLKPQPERPQNSCPAPTP